ncbi:MAG: hypothetical protein RIR51_551 [Bacteroidota bacterium]
MKTSISQVVESRINRIDFDNLIFGRTFADHMYVAEYANGDWQSSKIVPYGPMEFQPALMSIHYGQSIFEGLKAYKGKDGKVRIFRPEDNFNRLNISAERMAMPLVPREIFMDNLKELIKLDSAWVPEKEGYSLYIRPFMFGTDEYLGVSPSKTYRFMIINSPVGAYYSKPLRVKIETEYIRAAKGGVGYSKNAGNYAGSLYPTAKAVSEGYDQLIWTDAKEHKYIEEAGTMNIMFMIDGKLVSAAPSTSILDGITRRSIIQIAKDWGIEVEERSISVEELIEGIESGKVQEAFGAGTAAVITHISEIGYKGKNYQLPETPKDAFTLKVLKEINDLKLGLIPDRYNWILEI